MERLPMLIVWDISIVKLVMLTTNVVVGYYQKQPTNLIQNSNDSLSRNRNKTLKFKQKYKISWRQSTKQKE